MTTAAETDLPSASPPVDASPRNVLSGSYWQEMVAVALVLSSLAVVLGYNPLLFNLSVEMIAVTVGFTTFAVAWNTRTVNQSSFLGFVGLSFPAVAVLDLLHAAAEPGMGVFRNASPDLSLHLDLAARFIQIGSVLAALAFGERKLRTGDVLLAQGAALTSALMVIFLFEAWPDSHTADGSPTLWNSVEDALLIGLSAVAFLALWLRRERFTRGVLLLAMAGVGLMIPHQLADAAGGDPYGPVGVISHYLKLLSFYCLYKAIIVTTLRNPYELVFYRMCRSEAALRDHLANLESIVTLKTAELRESEGRLRVLLECSSDWFWETDGEGSFTVLSSGVTEGTGRSASQLMGRKLGDLLDPARPPEDYAALLDAQNRCEPFRRLSLPLAVPAGEQPRWISVSGVPRFDARGRFTGYRGTVADVTARRQAAEALQRKQTMAALGSLVGGLAHEVNNLLQPVVTLSELGLPLARDSERLKLYLKTIHDCSLGARAVLQDSLRFARVEVTPSPPADLKDAIEAAVVLIGPSLPAGIGLQIDLDPRLPTVTITQAEMTQVLLNLFKNSADAMPDGGILTVRAATVQIPMVDASRRGLIEGTYVRLTVTDSGVGMDEETRQRAFEPFFTTKPLGEGTGLGLAVVYGIVRNHGGDVTIRSLPAHGTSVEVELPVMTPQP